MLNETGQTTSTVEIEIASGPMFLNSRLSQISSENARSRKYNSLHVLLGMVEKFPIIFKNLQDDRVNPAIAITVDDGSIHNVRVKTLASWMKKRADGIEWTTILQGRRGRVAKITVPDFDLDDM